MFASHGARLNLRLLAGSLRLGRQLSMGAARQELPVDVLLYLHSAEKLPRSISTNSFKQAAGRGSRVATPAPRWLVYAATASAVCPTHVMSGCMIPARIGEDAPSPQVAVRRGRGVAGWRGRRVSRVVRAAAGAAVRGALCLALRQEHDAVVIVDCVLLHHARRLARTACRPGHALVTLTRHRHTKQVAGQ